MDQFDIRAPLLHEFVTLHARWYPDKPAVIDEQSTLTWQQLEQRANRVANGLITRGISPGDSVAMLMRNCVEYVEIMYGILKAGAVIVPLNLAVPVDGLGNMLTDANARVLFFTTDQQSIVDALVVKGWGADAVDVDSNDYRQWRDRSSQLHPDVLVGEDWPVNIIYSSGTTGLPKGIKHIARRRTQSMYELALAHRYHFGAISICPIGLYSNIAWASLFCALIVGGTCVIQNGFDTGRWLNDVERFEVTHTMMVPLQFQRILEDPAFQSKRVSSLEAIISGGSPLYAQLKKRIADEFRCSVIELYGLTEGFMTTLQPEEAEGRLSSVGKPVRGHDYRIVNEKDRVLPWGNTGEICVRSVHWMLEYHNQKDATRECMFFDPSGVQWLRTGDIGRVDEQGYLYIVDRKKDMILSGGQNIYPADIEAVMITHPAVSEVAVIGVPHATWGETPLAIAVMQPGVEWPEPQQLTAWTNERVGKRQRISATEFTTDLPRNANGKILKRQLREARQHPT